MSDYPTPTTVSQNPTSATPAMSPVQESSPYQTPGSYDPAPAAAGEVSATAIHFLVRTRKWVRFCSVMGFIGAAFLVLAAISMMLVTSMAGSLSGVRGAGFGVGLGSFYLILAALYIYPSIRLWQYASSISRLETSRDSFSLEAALDKQRSFWKFVRIMVIITVVFYLVMILFFAIGSVSRI